MAISEGAIREEIEDVLAGRFIVRPEEFENLKLKVQEIDRDLNETETRLAEFSSLIEGLQGVPHLVENLERDVLGFGGALDRLSKNQNDILGELGMLAEVRRDGITVGLMPRGKTRLDKIDSRIGDLDNEIGGALQNLDDMGKSLDSHLTYSEPLLTLTEKIPDIRDDLGENRSRIATLAKDIGDIDGDLQGHKSNADKRFLDMDADIRAMIDPTELKSALDAWADRIPSDEHIVNDLVIPNLPEVPTDGYIVDNLVKPNVPSDSYIVDNLVLPNLPHVPTDSYILNNIVKPNLPDVPTDGYIVDNLVIPNLPDVPTSQDIIDLIQPLIPEVPTTQDILDLVMPHIPTDGYIRDNLVIPNLPTAAEILAAIQDALDAQGVDLKGGMVLGDRLDAWIENLDARIDAIPKFPLTEYENLRDLVSGTVWPWVQANRSTLLGHGSPMEDLFGDTRDSFSSIKISMREVSKDLRQFPGELKKEIDGMNFGIGGISLETALRGIADEFRDLIEGTGGYSGRGLAKWFDQIKDSFDDIKGDFDTFRSLQDWGW